MKSLRRLKETLGRGQKGRIRPVLMGFLLLIVGLAFDQWWWKVGGIIVIVVFVDSVLRSPKID